MASGRDCVECIPRVTWVAASREQLVFGSGIGPQWEPEEALCVIGVLPEGTFLRCGNSTLKMDRDLLDQLSDLMDCFGLLWDEGEGDVSFYCDSQRVFPQNWLQSRLSNRGLLEAAGVRFDVLDINLFCAADSVRFDTESVMSDVTGDGAGIPMTTVARSRGGDSGLSVWLNFVSQGTGPMAPPIRARLRTVVFF